MGLHILRRLTHVVDIRHCLHLSSVLVTFRPSSSMDVNVSTAQVKVVIVL